MSDNTALNSLHQQLDLLKKLNQVAMHILADSKSGHESYSLHFTQLDKLWRTYQTLASQPQELVKDAKLYQDLNNEAQKHHHLMEQLKEIFEKEKSDITSSLFKLNQEQSFNTQSPLRPKATKIQVEA